MAFVASLLFGVLVLLSLFQSRRPLTSRTWMLLRSLLPSWRFFEDVEPGPELSCCVVGSSYGSPWQRVLEPPTRRGLFLNAEGNLFLAQQSLVEQLWSELDGVAFEAAPDLTSYRLVQRLVERHLREHGQASAGARYRFRLTSGPVEGDVDFESVEHTT